MRYKLDKEEQEILKSFENGEWKQIANMKEEHKKYKISAKNKIRELKETKNIKISLCLNEWDLEQIKIKAKIEGLPYQSLIGSVLHKYANR